MTTPEGKVKDKVKKLLERHNTYVFMPVPGRFGSKTVDFLVCAYGHFVAIETKAPGKKPTPLQDTTLDDVVRARGHVFVIDSTLALGELASWLDRAAKQYQENVVAQS